MDKDIEFRVDRIFRRGKFNRLRNYIKKNIKINNFCPQEPKYLKRNDNLNEKESFIFNSLSGLYNFG